MYERLIEELDDNDIVMIKGSNSINLSKICERLKKNNFMFYHFLIPLIENFHFLNLFNYLTFRAGGALFTAFSYPSSWVQN